MSNTRDLVGWEVVPDQKTNTGDLSGWEVVPEANQAPKPTLNMPNFPFVNRPQTPEEQQQTAKNVVQGAKGAAQSLLNTPQQAAQALGGNLYKPFNFAPQTTAANVGGVLGDIASYALPGGAVKGAVKGLSYIPKVGEGINALRAGMQTKPILNFLAKLAGNAGQAGLFEAEKNPNATGRDIAESSIIGGGLPLATETMFGQNPLLSHLAKLSLGAGAGYHFGGLPGIAGGIASAYTIPRAIKELNLAQSPVASELLPSQPKENALLKYQAGQRIGDVPTPAEAFMSPPLGAKQGQIARTEHGQEAMADYGVQRQEQQKNAINRLLDKVDPKTEENDAKVNALYKQAGQSNVSENALYDLMQDPVIRRASVAVQKEPEYQKDLSDVRPTSFAYLDMVKRAMDDAESEAIRKGQTNKANIIRDSRKALTARMDAIDSTYSDARALSQKQIIRRNIEDRLGKLKTVSGKTFYNEFLSNDNKFNKLKDDLETNPEAQDMLRDMKTAWDGLIGYDTAASASGMAQRHTSSAREGFQKFWNEYKDTVGAPRDVERAKFIHDPNWWDKFDDVMKYRDKLVRAKKLSDLVAQGLSAGTLEYSAKTK